MSELTRVELDRKNAVFGHGSNGTGMGSVSGQWARNAFHWSDGVGAGPPTDCRLESNNGRDSTSLRASPISSANVSKPK